MVPTSNRFVDEKKKLQEQIESSEFEDALITTESIIKKKPTQEATFRIGFKSLNLLCSIKNKQHLCLNLFQRWMNFCLAFDQTLVTTNNIIYYGVMLSKSLLAEKHFDAVLIILQDLQDVYTFLCDDKLDSDSEKYLKYLAPLCYNQAINKNLGISQPQMAMKLFVHGIKFYSKILSSIYMMYDTLRIFIIPFTKTEKIDNLYDEVFDFLYNSINSHDCVRLNETVNLDNVTNIGEHVNKQIYLIKTFLNTFIQYASLCYSNHLSTHMINTRLTQAKNLCKYKSQWKINIMECDDDLTVLKQNTSLTIETLTLCISYLNQFSKKVTSESGKSSSSASNGRVQLSTILKENSTLEKKIKQNFTDLYSHSLEADSFYYYWSLYNLLDFFTSSLTVYLNDQSAFQKYIQESLIECLCTVCYLFSQNIMNFYRLYPEYQDHDKISKSIFTKPVLIAISTQKIIEQLLKQCNQSNKEHPKSVVTSAYELINSHLDFLKWMEKLRVFSSEDIVKNYLAVETQAARLCSNFYSEDKALDTYIKFQHLSLNISTVRLTHSCNVTPGTFDDISLMKNFEGICDNLFLSLRLNKKFDEARQVLGRVHSALVDVKQEQKELEWIVSNWCKIKRDAFKIKAEYPDEYAKMQHETLVDYLDVKNSDIAFQMLLEEIRIYNYFRSMDNLLNMIDETYNALEKLSMIKTNDLLLKCRIQMEIAQFCWMNYNQPHNIFKLTPDEYYEMAKSYLYKHKCSQDISTSASYIDLTSLVLNDTDDNKENDSKNNRKRNSISPMTDAVMIDVTPTTNNKPKRRRLKNTQSPLIKLSPKPNIKNSPKIVKEKETIDCDCLSSQMLLFELNIFKALCDYAKIRNRMYQSMIALMQSRAKIKESTQITTNVDSLNLQTVSSACLICPEMCNETELVMKDDDLIKQLDKCLTLLESLSNLIRIKHKDSFKMVEKMLKKEFYESVDLLAQLYGFFGLLKNRCSTLKLKLDIVYLDWDNKLTNEVVFSNTVLNLMKAYLNVNSCMEFEEINKKLLSECTEKDKSKEANLVSSNKSSPVVNLDTNKKTKSKKNVESSDKLCLDAIFNLIEKHKFISTKQESLMTYHLVLTHYYILKNEHQNAIKIMSEKIIKSTIYTGKLTPYHYEVKYYLKFLQFIMSMSNLEDNETKFQEVIDGETSLSLLEDCYTSAFSVAKYYMQGSIEPSRTLNTIVLTNSSQSLENTDNQTEKIFFDISNPECYRILSEALDIMDKTCKYFIEISRYRDASGYIREALDITQLHFTHRRISVFLLHQIDADIIATCYNEAQNRMKLAQHLIGQTQFPIDASIKNDISKLRNLTYFNYLNILKEIRENAQSGQLSSADSVAQAESSDHIKLLNIIKSSMHDIKEFYDYSKDLLVEIALIILNNLKTNSSSKSQVSSLFKLLKAMFSKSGDSSRLISYQEKWHLADFYCSLYESSGESKTNLITAYNLLKYNPHPNLFKRILFNLFKQESNDLIQKLSYLLETQAISLRHKACSIQIKHKRRSTIDLDLFDKLINSYSFEKTQTKEYLNNFLKKTLPNNCVVVSLVLDQEDLYMIRLEKNAKPGFYKFKYLQKYTESFRTIMTENDKSMKQSERAKFWSSRNALNKKLSIYLSELETHIFSYYKTLLLGSFSDFEMNDLVDQFKETFGMTSQNMSSHQEDYLKIIINGTTYYNDDEIAYLLKKGHFDAKKASLYINFIQNTLKTKLVTAKRKHVCLLIDKNLHQIPWESLPITRNQPITRMPSIHFLSSHIQINSMRINRDKAFYIVDPGSDLSHTREKFQTFFEKIGKNWTGIIGVAPNETQFKKALTEYELFIYTGHGSGSQYYPSDDVQKLRIQACSILMGCSSGNQYVLGDFEPYGTVLAYILGGCPCIVGNLWDVTDRDIDRLTEEFLESWIKEDELNEKSNDTTYNSICTHLISARKACKMSYLNGSAPIVYGLPINFK